MVIGRFVADYDELQAGVLKAILLAKAHRHSLAMRSNTGLAVEFTCVDSWLADLWCQVLLVINFLSLYCCRVGETALSECCKSSVVHFGEGSLNYDSFLLLGKGGDVEVVGEVGSRLFPIRLCFSYFASALELEMR